MNDGHGNWNNLLMVTPEDGITTTEPEEPEIPPKLMSPTTALDMAHLDADFQEDEEYEDAPLLPHERPSLSIEGGLDVDPGQPGRRTSLGTRISRVHTFVPPEPTKEDLRDPGLEKFPVGKSGILNRMQTLRKELPIDDSSHLDGNHADTMNYHLTRSLAHLVLKDKPDSSAVELTASEDTSNSGTKSKLFKYRPFSLLTDTRISKI